MNWIKRHKILILSASLIALLGVNIWLFGDNFITKNQLLTEAQLNEHNNTLSEIAQEASQIANRQSLKPLPDDSVIAVLDPLQHRADEIVLRLQTASYPVELDERVEQSLKLAQVLSFTLHNYELQPSTALSSANMSQVLHQTSVNAANLNQR